MVIGQINGGSPGRLSPQTSTGVEPTGFRKVLAEETAALSTPAHPRSTETPTAPQTASSPGLVKIGTITSKIPTVSNLLFDNPVYKKDCWDIVYNARNRDKAYTRIPTGTAIYFNPKTKELLWGDMVKDAGAGAETATTPRTPSLPAPLPVESAESAEAVSSDDGLNEKLLAAVKPLIGTAYSDVNCYQLLVDGLSKLGVHYHGRNGLASRLMALAADRGLPRNAYLNGEGLIRFSGSELYRKSLLKVTHPEAQARRVIREMLPHLERGSILSFSTETRGHTGVVSRKNGEWTFINSGLMDNPVSGTALPTDGVGEEDLDKEIEAWFRLAARHGESLVITLGKLNPNKLAAYETAGRPKVS